VRRSAKVVVAVVGGLALVVLGTIGWLALAPRDVPAGQPALDRLDAAELPEFRNAFNASPDAVRVLVLLSPT
jgi:hypothetical protein